jgi:hypothetical protein
MRENGILKGANFPAPSHPGRPIESGAYGIGKHEGGTAITKIIAPVRFVPLIRE